MSKERHMKKRKHNFIYYLAPIVVLIAIGSVTVSYIYAKNDDQQPKTETANKQKPIDTSSSLQEKQSNLKESSQTNTQQAALDDKASSHQPTMDDLQKLIIPSEFDGVWYYYDIATEKIETLKIYQNVLKASGQNGFTNILYATSEKGKVKANTNIYKYAYVDPDAKDVYQQPQKMLVVQNWNDKGDNLGFYVSTFRKTPEIVEVDADNMQMGRYFFKTAEEAKENRGMLE